MSIVPSNAGSREAITGAELALRLLAAFRGLVDELHDRLAAEGHPAARPIHGFALQATQGRARCPARRVEAGRGQDHRRAGGPRLRHPVRGPGRRPSEAHRDHPDRTGSAARSAAIFERLRSDRVALLGEEQMAEVEAALRVLAPAASFPLDAAGWFGG